MNEEAKERAVPTILIVAGVVLTLLAAMLRSGDLNPVEAYFRLQIAVIISALLMLVGAFITAKLIGVSFGAPGPAFLKLAAIAIFPGGLAAAVNIPGLSWVISVILYLSLLTWLFDLDLKEALIFTGVMIIVNIAANILLVSLLRG